MIKYPRLSSRQFVKKRLKFALHVWKNKIPFEKGIRNHYLTIKPRVTGFLIQDMFKGNRCYMYVDVAPYYTTAKGQDYV